MDRAPAEDNRRWCGPAAYAMAYAMGYERHVKLFKNGRSQAVRIPREFELPGTDAWMRKEGDKVIIESKPRKSLVEWLRTAEPIDEEIGDIPDYPPEPVDL